VSEASLHPADAAAFIEAIRAQPVWDRIETGASACALAHNLLLHAGPAFASPDTISRPVLNSACVAAVFEGLADSFERAEAMIRAGEIDLRPAQDYSIVTPLAAVVSASMPLHRVVDATRPENRIFAPINGGGRPALRLGLRSPAVLEHLRWLNGEFRELLESGLREPLPLLPIARAGLQHGDDCHGRTPHATRTLLAQLEQAMDGGIEDANAREFIDASPSLFLNLWMAASKCIMMRASGIEGSSLVTAAGGNGVETGIQIAAFPGRWFSRAATPPRGRLDVDLPAARALPAIGDSAVVEALGLGAMAIDLAPEQLKALRDFLPADYRARSARLLAGVHPQFAGLECRVGLLARAVADYRHGPVIGLGILDVEGERGRIGGGIYDMPATVFCDAVAALDASAQRSAFGAEARRDD
jgi:hypothetical protein